MTLHDSANAAQGTGTVASIVGTTAAVTVAGNTDAAVITGVAIVISG